MYTLHEPRPDLFDIGVDFHRGVVSEKSVIEELKFTRLSLINGAVGRQRSVYVESNPNASVILPQIMQAFPNYRILWITRDVDTYLPSAYNKSPDDSGTMFFYSENDHRKRLTAEDFKDDRWRTEWSNFTRAERIAWWWQKCNSLLLGQTQNDPRCMRVGFENLFDHAVGPELLRRIVCFLGGDDRQIIKDGVIEEVISKPCNETRHVATDDAGELRVADDGRLRDLTSSVRRSLGYI